MQLATIVARRELARASTLVESLRRHNSRTGSVVLVLDASPEEGDEIEQFQFLTPAALGVDDFAHLAARLELNELREAIKPRLVRHVLASSPGETLLYVEADSYVCGPLDDLDTLARDHGLLTWARTRDPLPADGRRPNEADLFGWGLYDRGLFALGGAYGYDELLDWWEAHAGDDSASAEMERVMTIAPDHHEVRDPGLGASFWNLNGHALGQRDGLRTVDDVPLRLIRLTGYDIDRPVALSSLQDRIHAQDSPSLVALLEEYASRLAANGEPRTRKIPYRWEILPDGTRLDPRLRVIYGRAVKEDAVRRSPFTRWGMEEFYSWLSEPDPIGGRYGINRLCRYVWEVQTELSEAYPDLGQADQAAGFIGWLNAYGLAPGTLPRSLVPPVAEPQAIAERGRTVETPWGINVAGYFESELGIGEVARLTVAALDSVSIPLLPVTGRIAPPSRKRHAFATLGPRAARFPVNLVCVNGDGLPGFREDVGGEFFADRYTIGMWWWEVAAFPRHWQEAFGIVDEVWAGTEHVAGALLTESPVPVYIVTIPVVIPPLSARVPEKPDTSDDFEFLFMFDYHSVFERKNPLGVIEAFRNVFTPGSGARLAIKCVNSGDDPSNHARLLAASAGREDITIRDGYLTPRETHALIARCDCYVSLHRSEGFGLTPAEAMALGKPVIATGYSGNLDYMSPANAYLVGYAMTEIGTGNAPYPADGEWADPDLQDAASLMREVFDHPEAARERGTRAARDIARTHSLEAAGKSMYARLENLRRRIEPVPERRLPSPPSADALAREDARDLLSRLTRRVARRQLGMLYDRLAELHTEIAELRGEREHDKAQVRHELTLLEAEMLAAIRSASAVRDDEG